MPEPFKTPGDPANASSREAVNPDPSEPDADTAAEKDHRASEEGLLRHMRTHYDPAMLKLLRRGRRSGPSR